MEPHVRVVADQSEAVRADEPDPVPPGTQHELVLKSRTTVSHLAEPGGDHDRPPDPSAGCVLQRGQDTLGRDRDHPIVYEGSLMLPAPRELWG